MAESSTITTPTNLFVAFWHGDRIEDSAIVADPDAALAAAIQILERQPCLVDGDAVMVTALKRPGVVQRGLA